MRGLRLEYPGVELDVRQGGMKRRCCGGGA